MSQVFAQFWRLMKLCLAGPGGKWSIALFAVIVALDLGGVYAHHPHRQLDGSLLWRA